MQRTVGGLTGNMDLLIKMQTDNRQYNGVADVFSLDYEGRGIARFNGKTLFIEGAISGERVQFEITRSKKQFDEARTVSIVRRSKNRIEPECRYFDTCGGCSVQHIDPTAQVAFKQRIMEEQLERIGKVRPERILPAIYGTPWHYRNRARLSIAKDAEGRLKIGFRGKKSHDVIDLDSCRLLPVQIAEKLPDIKSFLQSWTDLDLLFIEFFNSEKLTVLNICSRKKPSSQKSRQLENWFDTILACEEKPWQIWLQTEKIPPRPFYPNNCRSLSYVLPEFGVKMPYRPGDFTQINADLNGLMVGRALKLLEIRKNERIADLFCGLGNFSIPMAKSGAEVVGIEGEDSLVRRARDNASENGCRDKISFLTADLFETDEETVTSWGKFDKMLLDPPRSGAYAVVKSLHAPYLPKRIVYVSCNPATLARDAEVLINKGYRLKSAGVMNMFAQTSHVESIGVFDLVK